MKVPISRVRGAGMNQTPRKPRVASFARPKAYVVPSATKQANKPAAQALKTTSYLAGEPAGLAPTGKAPAGLAPAMGAKPGKRMK